MQCTRVSEEQGILLMDYSAGRLEGRALSQIEAHLEGCPACRDFAMAQGRVWSALDVLPGMTASAKFDESLQARLTAMEAEAGGWKERLRRALAWRPALPIAATAAAAAVFFTYGDSGKSNDPRTPIDPQANMQMVDAEQVERALDDLEMLNELGQQEL